MVGRGGQKEKEKETILTFGVTSGTMLKKKKKKRTTVRKQ